MSAGFVLRVENGALAGQVFPLAAPTVVIGRHTEADIVLTGNQVSRRHARLELVDNRPLLTDLNSANGTFVNGSRLATPQPLSPGDLIELGEYRLRVEGPPGPSQAAAPAQDFAATQFIGATPQEPAQIAAGTILNGRYRLDRSIGQGGFARVFLANDLALKRPIAVKVMNVELVGESTIDDFLARFANEAQAIANLDHPHILAIHDFGQLGATGFLVMPFVAGGTLADALRSRGRFTPQVAARYLRQVATALDYAHRRNLVHRDIKPQNMLLRDEDDHLLLADFGIAKVISATSAQSRTGVVGTIAYMAPEQFQGQVSRATDVYALGCVLFQWLTGKLPFGGSTEEVIYGHISAPVPLLANSGADLPPAAQAVIARALAKRSEDSLRQRGRTRRLRRVLAAPSAAQPADADEHASSSSSPARSRDATTPDSVRPPATRSLPTAV
ncbi:MAG: FHA domain-containing serine/threonine-protein kinase [Thermomicrobiales bacterium]